MSCMRIIPGVYAMDVISGILVVLVFMMLMIPVLQKKVVETKRMQAIRRLENKRRSRVITMIHRQEALSFLGMPFFKYIDIEDSERILRACRLTPGDMPIDIILHTPGGLVLASEQIAFAIKKHKARVTVFIPHYAMSGGSLIALAADEVVMDSNAVLGAMDPQVGSIYGQYPAASILEALKTPNPNRDDKTLILADVAKKAIRQVRDVVYELLRDTMDDGRAHELAQKLSEGYWTHDYPITSTEAKGMGLNISEDMPVEIYTLMDYYPQPTRGRPSVEYIPVPYGVPQEKKGE